MHRIPSLHVLPESSNDHPKGRAFHLNLSTAKRQTHSMVYQASGMVYRCCRCCWYWQVGIGSVTPAGRLGLHNHPNGSLLQEGEGGGNPSPCFRTHLVAFLVLLKCVHGHAIHLTKPILPSPEDLRDRAPSFDGSSDRSSRSASTSVFWDDRSRGRRHGEVGVDGRNEGISARFLWRFFGAVGCSGLSPCRGPTRTSTLNGSLLYPRAFWGHSSEHRLRRSFPTWHCLLPSLRCSLEFSFGLLADDRKKMCPNRFS